MAAPESEIARIDPSGTIVLRHEPLRIQWQLENLLAADGHRLQGRFSATVQALAEPAEQQLLREVFLGHRPVVTTDDVVRHLAPSLQSAAAETARTQPVEHWLSAPARTELISAIRQAADAAGFICGLKLLPPFQLELQSPTWHQQQVEQLQRNLAQQRVAGQLQHLQRATELLRQFQAMRDTAPGLRPGVILDQINPGDRAAMLETLLRASAQNESALDLWACAGQSLVRIKSVAPGDAETPQIISLPGDIGPLRSVQPATIDGARLLVGARSGLMIVDPQAPLDPQVYREPHATSALGFSSALFWNGQLWATHSELGLVAWDLQQPQEPCRTVRPAELFNDEPTATQVSGPRNLQQLDQDRLIFSAGTRLMILNREGHLQPLPLEPRNDIVAIVPEPDHVVVVHEDGQICRRTRSTLEVACREQRGLRVTAAGALPWLGSPRLLLCVESASVWCVGLDDQLITQYASTHRDLRMVAGSPACVAAVSADRQRLVLWSSWDGQSPHSEIHITGLTRHRIADIAFA